ncbi:MAG: hypothetical protein WC761_01680 [Candidatus Paceibacterota bacterium]|jgi:hypothetical protein
MDPANIGSGKKELPFLEKLAKIKPGIIVRMNRGNINLTVVKHGNRRAWAATTDHVEVVIGTRPLLLVLTAPLTYKSRYRGWIVCLLNEKSVLVHPEWMNLNFESYNG